MYRLSDTTLNTRPLLREQVRDSIDHAVESLECSFIKRPPVWKRGLDLAGAVLALVFLSPVLGVIYLSIKIVSPGPVLFKQERVGYLGQSFRMYKFRTMKVNCEENRHETQIRDEIRNNLTLSKIDNDSRIFPLGSILRKSCLDELPQLLNVLKGEMSLVGPRPELPYAVAEFKCWHCARLHVLPGITGMWQINGKNSTTFEQMIRYDINYIRRLSFVLDVKILFLTIPAIVKQVSQGEDG